MKYLSDFYVTFVSSPNMAGLSSFLSRDTFWWVVTSRKRVLLSSTVDFVRGEEILIPVSF